MTLPEIKAYFEQKVRDDNGVLNATVQDLDALAFQNEESVNHYLLLLNNFPGLSMTLDGASLTLENDSTLIASGSLPEKFKPTILSGSICSVKVTFEKKESIQISMALDAILKLGQTEYSITFQQTENGILVGGIKNIGAIELNDFSSVFPNLKINSKLPSLPSYIDILSGLSINAIHFLINLKSPFRSKVQVKISNSALQSITLVDDMLELKDVHAVVSLSGYSDKTASVGLNLFSTIQIDGKPFSTKMSLINRGIQKLEIIPEKGLDLPTLDDLLILCGFSGSFPNLADISITGFYFGVNIHKKKLAYFRITADAHLDLLDTTFVVDASIPDFTFKSSLKEMNSISIDHLMEKIGLEVPLLSGTQIGQLDVGYYNSNYSLGVGIDSFISLPLPVNEITLLQTTGFFQYNSEISSYDLTLSTVFKISDLVLELQASYDKDDNSFSFSGDTRRGGALELTTLAQELFGAFEVSLPSWVPAVSLSNMSFAYEHPKGNYSAHSDIESDFALEIGELKIELPTAKFDIKYQDQKTNASISAHARVAEKPLSFTLDLIGSKSISGTIETVNQDEKIDFLELLDKIAPGYFSGLNDLLDVGFSKIETLLSEEQTKVDFIGDLGINIGPASLHITKLSLNQNNANNSWNISSTGNFQLSISDTQKLTIEAELSIGKRQSATFIQLKISQQNLVAAIRAIGFDQTITKLITDVINLFEEEITISVTKQNGNYTLEVDHLLKPIVISVHPTIVEGKTLDLGDMSLAFTNFALTLGSKTTVSMDIAMGLPSKLNDIFGTDAEGNAEFNIFKVYDSTKSDNNAAKLKLTADTTGLRLTLDNSPIEALKIEDGKWNLKLGKDAKYGEIIFDLPEFGYNSEKGSFRLSTGFDIPKEHPLSIPLAPVLNLLDAFGFKHLKEELPESIPIKGIELTKDNKIDLSKVEVLVGTEVYNVIKGPLEEMNTQFEKLPTRFVDYLNIEIPQSLYLDVNIDTQASVSIDISVYDPDVPHHNQPDKKPVRLLIPSTTGFYGVALKKFSFGELLSGSLFSMEVDVVVDYFDFVTLAASLAVPEDLMKYVSDTNTLQTTLTIENLFAIIVYQTTVPIPIPLFFDDIGFDYVGIIGADANAHVGFPKPSMNIVDLFTMLRSLYQYFTERDTLMPTERPQGMDLDLIVGHTDDSGNQIPIGFKTPKYLGDETLGIPYIDISAYQTFAHFLNFCKAFSVKEALEAIDIDKRVNTAQASFFGLETSAKWLITSPDEFRAIGYNKLEMTNEQMESALSLIPSPNNTLASDKNDLVMFLYGSLSLNDLLTFSSTFGLYKEGNVFATGLILSGSFLEDTVQTHIKAQLKTILPDFNSDSPGPFMFDISGDTNLKVSATDIFAASGKIFISDDGIKASGSVKTSGLLPLHTDVTAEFLMSKAEEKIQIAIQQQASIFGLDIAHTENAMALILDPTEFFFKIESSTQFLSNLLSLSGSLQIISDGISGELQLALTSGETFSLLGINLGMQESSYIKLQITPSSASFLLHTVIDIPHIISGAVTGGITAGTNRNFAERFSGTLNIGDPETPLEISLGIATIKSILGISVSTQEAAIKATNSSLTLIGHDLSLEEFTISTNGDFSVATPDTLSLGQAPILLLELPGIIVGLTDGSLSITTNSSSQPKITISGVTYDSSHLNFATLPYTTDIKLSGLQFGVITFTEADYQITITDKKEDISLVLLHSTSFEINLLGTGSSLTLNSFDIHSNGTIGGEVTGTINLGSIPLASTTFGISNHESGLHLHGSSTANVFGTTFNVTGDIYSSGKFSFGGSVQSSAEIPVVAKVEYTAEATISDDPLLSGKVTGTVYLWENVFIGREKTWKFWEWEWKDIYKWEWVSKGSFSAGLNSDGTFEVLGHKFRI